MPNNFLIEVEDQRRGLLDSTACGEIYRVFLQYIRSAPLSEAWGPPRVPRVYQHQRDLVDEEGEIVSKSDMAFIVGLSAVRKRDGLDFHCVVRIPPEQKGNWEVIREFFSLLRISLEQHDCLCTKKVTCRQHALTAEPAHR